MSPFKNGPVGIQNRRVMFFALIKQCTICSHIRWPIICLPCCRYRRDAVLRQPVDILQRLHRPQRPASQRVPSLRHVRQDEISARLREAETQQVPDTAVQRPDGEKVRRRRRHLPENLEGVLRRVSARLALLADQIRRRHRLLCLHSDGSVERLACGDGPAA